MKCAKIQNRLLAAERPDQVGADVQRHLAECVACRATHERLVEIERAIPQLAVPSSTRRSAFVAQFIQHTPVELPVAETVPTPVVRLMRPMPSVKERGLRKLAFAFALAASLAVVAVGLWVVNPGKPTKTDYAATHKIHLESRLRSAVEPRDRAITVLGVADEVRDEVRTLAQAPKDADGEKMAELAKYYRQLVGEELKRYVHDLPADANRKVVLSNLEQHLQQTESEFTLLAATKGATKAAEPLQMIALAARESSADLHALATE